MVVSFACFEITVDIKSGADCIFLFLLGLNLADRLQRIVFAKASVVEGSGN